MGTCAACFTYGGAAGVDLSVGLGCLVFARRQRRRDPILSLAAVALTVAGTTGLLCSVHHTDEYRTAAGMDQALALTTLSAFLPLVWCVGVAWSHQEDDDRLNVAVFYLAVTALFAINRYDALVADGTIRTIFLQPLTFPVLVAGLGFRRRAEGLARLERSLDGLLLVDRVARVMGSAGEVTPAVETALGVIGPRLGASAAAVAVRRADGHEDLVEWLASPLTEHGAASVALDRVIGRAPGASRLLPSRFHTDTVGGHTIVAAPLEAEGRRWGTFWLIGTAPRGEVDAQRDTIERVGNAIGQAIQRSHRLAEHETLAATDERNRIARELHDSVTQTLYSVAMVADALPAATDHDPAAARHQAGQIRSMTLNALGDLRVLLLEMRQSTLQTGSLGALVQQMAGASDGLVRVELDVSGEPGPPPPVKLTAYRIAHQAVTNARRHAAPSQIVVRLHQRSGTTFLSVADDGVGFDVDAVPPGRHGLQIMGERAASVDGDLRIDSRPGGGTVVRFTWPAAGLAPARIVDR